MSLSIGLLVGIVLWLIVSPVWSALGVAVVLLLSLSALLQPQMVSPLYGSWNRLALLYAKYARALILLIMFYTLFALIGRFGKSLRLESSISMNSLWEPLEMNIQTGYGSSPGVFVEESIDRSWISRLISWATGSRNWWVYSLLPFFILLSALEGDRDDSAFPSSIYTLY